MSRACKSTGQVRSKKPGSFWERTSRPSHKWKSLPRRGRLLAMSLGPSLPLAPCSTRERQSTRAKHRSRVVVITREARGRAPRVLTAPFGLDRSPADDGPNGQRWRKHRIPLHSKVGRRTKDEYATMPCMDEGRKRVLAIVAGENSRGATPKNDGRSVSV